MVRIIVPGPPEHCRRHRIAVVNGKARAFDPPKNKAAKRAVQDAAVRAMSDAGLTDPLIGPLSVQIAAYFPLAKSHHRKRNPRGPEPHTKKPDADNVAKIMLDGMTGTVYKDDTQVSLLQVIKVQCGQDGVCRTEISVSSVVP